jgi:hypothetical protein
MDMTLYCLHVIFDTLYESGRNDSVREALCMRVFQPKNEENVQEGCGNRRDYAQSCDRWFRQKPNQPCGIGQESSKFAYAPLGCP